MINFRNQFVKVTMERIMLDRIMDTLELASDYATTALVVVRVAPLSYFLLPREPETSTNL